MTTTILFALAIAAPAPYAGEKAREIKALSAEETHALLDGEGMGLARAAELNHYPGPRHVLDLADQLGLHERQRAAVLRIFDEMKAEARALGREIVDAEGALDRLFASAAASDAELSRATERIGALQGRLRAAHLRAHLRTRAILTAQQVSSYDTIRGYDGPNDADHHQMHHP